jgi:hypothetical protein
VTGTPPGPRASRTDVAGFGCIALAIGLAIGVQRTMLAAAKGSLLADPGVRAKSVGVAAAARALVASCGAAEWSIVGALVALVASAVVAEIRGRAVSRFVAGVLASRPRTMLLVAMLAVLAQTWVFDTGPLLRHDAHAQTGVTALVAENLRAGEAIDWSFRWYGGYPLVAAYGCGFHVVAALAAIALGSLEWGIKAVLLVAGIGTSLGAARLVLRMGCRPGVAVLAGLAPLLSFQHTHTLAWSGKFPEALLYALFPLLLAEAMDLAHATGRAGVRALAGFGLVGGAMAIVHPPLGALGCVVAAGFALAATAFGEGPRASIRTAIRLVVAAVVVLVLAAPLELGVMEERGWILLGRHGFHSGGVADFGLPSGGSLADLLLWRNGWTGDVHAYLGVTLVAGGLCGAVFAARRRRAGAAAVLVAMALCLAMLGGGYLASRASEFLVTLLAVGLALGLDAAGDVQSRRGLPLTVVACLCLVADLGPTLVQAPGAANYAASRAHLERMQAEAGGGRYLRFTRRGAAVGIDDTDNALDVAIDTPLGAHHYMAPNVWSAFTLALLNETRAALGNDDARAAQALRGFALQGVTVIGEDGRSEFGAPRDLPRGLATSPADGCVRLAAGSQVTFGGRVEIAPAPLVEALAHAPFSLYDKEWRAPDTAVRAAARDALDRMGLDAASPRAALLLVSADDATPALLAQGACRGEVLAAATSPALWHARIRVDSPGAVRLAVAWSPRLALSVDGAAPQTPACPDVTGATVLALSAGTHDVDLRPRPLAAANAWWASAAVAATLAVLRLRSRR